MSELQIDIREEPVLGALVVRLGGTLDIFTYQELRKQLQEKVGERHGVKMVVELSQMEYVASSGWAVLLSQSKIMQRLGGKMALCSMRDEIRRVFEVMNIQALLPAAFTVEQAVALLAGKEAHS